MNAPAFRAGRGPGLLRRTSIALALAFVVAACDDAPTAPVEAAPAELVASVEFVKLESLGEVFSVDVRVLDRDGRELSGVPLEWAVETPGVVEPVGGADFRSIANGDATIDVRVAASHPHLDPGGYHSGLPTTSVAVRVEQRAVSLRLVPDAPTAASADTVRLWYLGQERSLSAWAIDALGHPVHEVSGGVHWSADDSGITRAGASGRLTALGEGATTVHASALGMSGTIPVDVAPSLDLSACVTVAGSSGDCADARLTFAKDEY